MLPGIRSVEHLFTVPLDHARPHGEQIEIYARELGATDVKDSRPWLLFLQGGPGFASPRPLDRDLAGSWLGRALRDYRVLLLDQRGTGRSTPATRQTLPTRGDSGRQAEYLAHFRADSIVHDAELIRHRLTGGAPWSVLGQGFGGFCAVSYLSLAPQGLAEVFITGGLPPLDGDADHVYHAAYPRMEDKNALFYHRYPEDVDRARTIAEHLADHETVLPDGTLLTVEAFQSLGSLLGTTDGAERLHYLLENAFCETAHRRELSDQFQYQVQTEYSLGSRPLYALLQEACYAQNGQPTAWAAERVRRRFPRFAADQTLSQSTAMPILFTGETINPWRYHTDPALRPLRDLASAMADYEGWDLLYDTAALAANDVPVFATVYTDDLYVDTKQSLATAAAIRETTIALTEEYEHDGLFASGAAVLNDLFRAACAAR